ncbi:MAG: Fic family protein [Bacteroidaceae bacterium]|nr:Fic family protein [Bacteroidaceae bacterium]
MYIHQSNKWPHFIWNETLVTEKLVCVVKAASFLAGRLSTIGFDSQLSAVVETFTHDILASSEIEGVQLNSDQVRSSVARKLGVPITNETTPSHYVEGIVEMMMDATTNYKQPLTHERLFGWHNCLFPNGRSGLMPIDVGKYRTGEMKVVSGMFGREKTHYIAPNPEKVPTEMALFLDWFNNQEQEPNYIKSAIAHLWFVCIHPFDDGNGRIGRAIADMALSQADNSQMRFFSMSQQISKDKKSYYEVLEKTQKSDGDITLWLDWYLDCMLRAIDDSGKSLSQVLNKATFWQTHAQTLISERQRKVLNIYLDGYIGKLTTKNWARLSKTSLDTAARDIKDLVDKSILVPQSGSVRNVAYGISCSDSILLVPGQEIE